jgi:hypothetical protein
MILAGVRAAEEAGVPTAVLMHTLHRYHTHQWSRSPIGVVAAARGMRPGKLWNATDRVLVATDSALDPGAERTLPINVRYTGVVQAPIEPSTQKDKSLVLVSLSTIFFEGQEATLQAVLDALEGLSIGVSRREPSLPRPSGSLPMSSCTGMFHTTRSCRWFRWSLATAVTRPRCAPSPTGYRCLSCQCTAPSIRRWLERPWPRWAPGGFCPRLLRPGRSGARCGRSWRTHRTDTPRGPRAPACVRTMGRLPPLRSSKPC